MIATLSDDVGAAAIDELLAATVLEVADRSLTGRDLLAAGVVSGRWQELESELAHGLGLVAVCAPPTSEVSDEVRAFRLERKLLSAEDMRSWLRSRGLTMSDVRAAARRAAARRAGGEAQASRSADLSLTLTAEAIWTGALREVGWWLADRLLSAAAGNVNIEPAPLQRTQVQQLVYAEARTIAGARSPESGLERGRRLAWLVALDDAHRAWQERVSDTADVARLLRARELDWCRLELDEFRLASSGAAAEAKRQLAEGGDPRRIAADANATVQPRSLVLADAAPEHARILAGALAGEVSGPLIEDGDHVVFWVRERYAPSADQEDMVVRATAELLADAAELLRAGRVRWHERA
jgi:hypothetical protein